MTDKNKHRGTALELRLAFARRCGAVAVAEEVKCLVNMYSLCNKG